MLPPLSRVLGPALLAGAAFTGAAFLGCGLQTGGLSSMRWSGASTSSSTPAGTGGASKTSSTSTTATGGHPQTGTGGADAGTKDAAPPTFASCKARLAADPGDTNNVYDLVDASQQPYQAYCNMKDDGGGWTLALKIDGSLSTFKYDASLWTDTSALNPDQPGLETTEAKLASYWSVPFTEVRMGMIDGTETRWVVVPLTGKSLLDLVKNGGQTDAGRSAWEGLLASGSLQTSCNREGVDPLTQIRLGIVGDDDGDCSSPDSFIGFGATSSFGAPSGNSAHWFPDHGDCDTKTFGYVMVR